MCEIQMAYINNKMMMIMMSVIELKTCLWLQAGYNYDKHVYFKHSMLAMPYYKFFSVANTPQPLQRLTPPLPESHAKFTETEQTYSPSL